MSIKPSIFGGPSNVFFDPFVDVWDPFDDYPSEASPIANAQIDWKETLEAHVFKVDLPGMKKEEVKVEVEEGNILVISGERRRRKEEREEKNSMWHRLERSLGNFLRRFKLPKNAKGDEAKASMDNGVLTVTVPKQEVKKADVKTIEIE